MTQVAAPPGGLVDLGFGSVALFFFVLAVYYIFKIVHTLKGGDKEPRLDFRPEPRSACIQPPQLQSLLTNQVLQLSALSRVEDDGAALRDNMTLQTQLIKQMAHVLEELSKCAVRQEARGK